MDAWTTVLVSIAGGSLGGTGLKSLIEHRSARSDVRRRGRLIHEDFYRLQSTITRLYYRANHETNWGEPAWLLPALASGDDAVLVLGMLNAADFEACASALGWAATLRNAHDQKGTLFVRADLKKVYNRLDAARQILARKTGIRLRAHDTTSIIPAEEQEEFDYPALTSIAIADSL